MKKKNWYALYTNPKAEKKVYEQLKLQQIKSYCPTKIVVKQWSDRKKKVEEPLFKSYVFVHIDLSEYEKVRRVKGVVNFVYFLGKPAIVRDEEIENIKQFLSKVSHADIRFENEDKVQIQEGVLKNIVGTIDKQTKNTLRIRINQLGISLYAEIKKDFVKKINKP